ncbi:HAD family hydrolase [Mycoplasma todarodis]|nr:HAD family hydrolase [Mycoplasma todarodis]
MKIKAFAFDMDGTLAIPEGYEAHPETIKALREAQEQGYKIIFATGRPLCFAMPTAKEIGGISYIVSNNGTNIYEVETGKNLSDSHLNAELYKEVIKKAKETKSYISVSTVNDVYREYYHPTDKDPKWLNDFRFEGIDQPVEWFEQIINEERISQVSLKNTGEVIEELAKELREKFGKENAIHVSNSIFLDVNPNGVSKLTGIETAANKMGIDISEVMAFGDSGNDLKMLEGVGYGVCMGNGSDEAKAAADEVIGANDTDAIAKKVREVMATQSK